MNAYEYALKVEKDGEAYYRDLADKSPCNNLKKVFNLLADEELKHYALIQKLQNKGNVDNIDITLDTKNIFEILSSRDEKVDFSGDEIKFYKDAIASEEDAAKFYLENAEKLETENEKNFFLKLAKEESKHKAVLENILDFMQESSNLVGSSEF